MFRGHVDDRDIEAIVAGETRRPLAIHTLDHVQVSTGSHAIPTATVRMRGPDGTLRVATSEGDGPVDAVCRAVNQVIGEVAELVEFSVDAITPGINAVGGVTVRLRPIADASTVYDGDEMQSRERLSTGFAVHTDILVATAEAYVSALNALLRARTRRAGAVTPSKSAAVVPAGSAA